MILLELSYGGLELLWPRGTFLSWGFLNFLVGFLVNFPQVSVELVLLRERSGETEVAHHNAALIVEEQVSWLDVPVHQVGRVKELQRAQLIVEENFYVLLSNHGLWYWVEHFLKVRLTKVHDQEDGVEVDWLLYWTTDHSSVVRVLFL